MKNIYNCLILSALFVVIASCGKGTTTFIDTDIVTTVRGTDTLWDTTLLAKTNLSVGEFPFTGVEIIAKELQARDTILVDSFDAGTGATLTFPNDLVLTVPAGTCLNANNEVVTGKIVVKTQLIRGKGGAIIQNKPTSTGVVHFFSNGYFWASFSQNGQELHLLTGKPITVRYSLHKIEDMNVSVNKFPVGARYNGRFGFDWREECYDKYTGYASTWTDAINHKIGVEYKTKCLGWQSLGYVGNTSGTVNNLLNVTLPSVFTNLNTLVYIVYKNRNGVIKLNGDNTTKTFNVFGWNAYLPFNDPAATIVVIGYVNGKFYFTEKDITIPPTTATDGHSFTLEPVLADKEKIIEELNSL